jgi:hypothetical protein
MGVRCQKGAPPTPRHRERQNENVIARSAMAAGACVSGRCARDRNPEGRDASSRLGSREPGAREARGRYLPRPQLTSWPRPPRSDRWALLFRRSRQTGCVREARRGVPQPFASLRVLHFVPALRVLPASARRPSRFRGISHRLGVAEWPRERRLQTCEGSSFVPVGLYAVAVRETHGLAPTEVRLDLLITAQ